MVRVTTVVLVSSGRELAVAAAAVASGVLDADRTLILVATLAEAAELEPQLREAAEALAAARGLHVVSLNELIQPRHPLDWRLRDLTRADFAAALGSWPLTPGVSRLAHIGEPGGVHRTLQRLLGLVPVLIADSPELSAAAIAQLRRPMFLLGEAPGIRWAVRRARLRTKVIPFAALRRAAADLVAVGWPAPELRFGGSPVSWWARYLRADTTSVPAAENPSRPDRASADPDEEAAGSLEFVTRVIAELDAERA